MVALVTLQNLNFLLNFFVTTDFFEYLEAQLQKLITYFKRIQMIFPITVVFY